jgi:adenylate cyclase
MNWSVSDRRRLTTWLAMVFLGGLAGYFYVRVMYPMGEPLGGLRTGLVISGLAFGFELYGMRALPGRWLRRLSFAPSFLAREAVLTILVVAALVFNAALTRWLEGKQPIFHYALRDLAIDSAFSFLVIGFFLFVLQARRLIGARTLTNILLGRYHRPVKEQRVFVIFDLEGSTAIAATIGDERFHALLSEIFADSDREIVDHGGEVHSYVGDAMIATWPLGNAEQNGRAVTATFAVLERISRHAKTYRRRFGVTPKFRAALHGGPVVAGECGDSKRQITYLGDVLNVTSRLEALAKTMNADILISADLLPRIALPADVHARDRGEHALKGMLKPLQVFTLMRGPASLASRFTPQYADDRGMGREERVGA